MQRKLPKDSLDMFAALDARTVPTGNQQKSDLQIAQEKKDQNTLNDIYAQAKALFKQKFIELCAAVKDSKLEAKQQEALNKTEKNGLGFDPTEEDSSKSRRTILYWAIATRQSEEELNLVLTLGNEMKDAYSAQTYFENGGGRSVFAAALEASNETAIEMLLQENNKLATEILHQSGNMPAHYLIEYKKHSALQCLLSNAPEAAIACARDGTSPLHLAAESHNADAGTIIIDHILRLEGGKQYLDQPDRDGVTALHRAASNGNRTLVEKLLASGANPHKITSKKSILPEANALQVAAQHGQNEIFRILMLNGCRDSDTHKVNQEKLNPKMKCALALISYINECDAELNKAGTDDSPQFKGMTSKFSHYASSLFSEQPEAYTTGYSTQRKRAASSKLLSKILAGCDDPWASISKDDQATLKHSNYISKYIGGGSTTSAITKPLREHSNGSSDDELDHSRSPSPTRNY